MKRRSMLALTATAAAHPASVLAQAPKVYRIAVLETVPAGENTRNFEALRQGLRERALSLAALCVGGMVAARSVADPGLARELREAAYRQAQTVLKAASC